MILPLRRDALKERGHLDEADEDACFARSTPSQRLEVSLELWLNHDTYRKRRH